MDKIADDAKVSARRCRFKMGCMPMYGRGQVKKELRPGLPQPKDSQSLESWYLVVSVPHQSPAATPNRRTVEDCGHYETTEESHGLGDFK